MSDSGKLLDAKSWRLLAALQANARSPLKELAAQSGLSVSATAERLRKLEDAGVLLGYHAEISAEASGHAVSAVIGINVAQPQKRKFLDKLAAMPEVLECLHVTGADSYMLRVATTNMAGLEALIGAMNPFGETHSSIVLSTPIPRRGLRAPSTRSSGRV